MMKENPKLWYTIVLLTFKKNFIKQSYFGLIKKTHFCSKKCRAAKKCGIVSFHMRSR